MFCLGDDDDEEEGQIVSSKTEDKGFITPKWPNRVFAMECIRLILEVCKDRPEHIDLAQARKLKENSNGNFVISLNFQQYTLF